MFNSEPITTTAQIIKFPVNTKKQMVARPVETTRSDILFTHTVCGESLIDLSDRYLSIYGGDILICKENFSKREITPEKICIVFILPTSERVAKRLIYDENNDTVILKAANSDYKDRHFAVNEIEIKGIVVAFQRSI